MRRGYASQIGLTARGPRSLTSAPEAGLSSGTGGPALARPDTILARVSETDCHKFDGLPASLPSRPTPNLSLSLKR